MIKNPKQQLIIITVLICLAVSLSSNAQAPPTYLMNELGQFLDSSLEEINDYLSKIEEGLADPRDELEEAEDGSARKEAFKNLVSSLEYIKELIENQKMIIETLQEDLESGKINTDTQIDKELQKILTIVNFIKDKSIPYTIQTLDGVYNQLKWYEKPLAGIGDKQDELRLQQKKIEEMVSKISSLISRNLLERDVSDESEEEVSGEDQPEEECPEEMLDEEEIIEEFSKFRNDLIKKARLDMGQNEKEIEYWERISLGAKNSGFDTLAKEIDNLLVMLHKRQALSEALRTALEDASSTETTIDGILEEIILNDNAIRKKLYDKGYGIQVSQNSIYYWLTEAYKKSTPERRKGILDIMEHLKVYQEAVSNESLIFRKIILGQIVSFEPQRPLVPAIRDIDTAQAKKTLIDFTWRKIAHQFPNMEIDIENAVIYWVSDTGLKEPVSGRFIEKVVVTFYDENCKEYVVSFDIPIRMENETDEEYQRRHVELFTKALKIALAGLPAQR